MTRQPAVYIMASQRNGTLYTGITSDLIKRVWQHRHVQVVGFTQEYALHHLVYYELCDEMLVAIAREKQLKAGSCAKKLQLIESMNPEWRDLYDDIVGLNWSDSR